MLNKVILIGRLTKDPQLKFTPGNGKAVTQFNLAVDRTFKKEGQQQADFIPIVIWGKIAESTANYKKKGDTVAIVGRIQTRSYNAKDGTKRYITEVVADEIQFLANAGSSNSNNINAGNSNPSNGNQLPDDNITPIDDGDIPF